MSAAANYREGLVILKNAGFLPSGVEKTDDGAVEPMGDGSEGRTKTSAKVKAVGGVGSHLHQVVKVGRER